MNGIDLSRYSGPEFIAHWTYWQARLQGAESYFQLPGDLAAGESAPTRAQKSYVILPADWEAVARISGGKVIERMVLVAAALRRVMERYYPQAIPVFHFPEKVSGQAFPLVFSKELPATLRDLIIETDGDFRQALDHANLPLAAVLQRYGLDGSTGKSDIFLSDADWSTADENRADYPLSLQVAVVGTEVKIHTAYAGHRFSETWIDQVMEHLIAALRAFQDVQQKCAESDLLSAENYQQLAAWGNGPVLELPANQTVPDLIAAQAAMHPTAEALVFDGDPMTYQELNAKANRIAHYLQSEVGLQAGDRCGIYLGRGTDRYVAMLAVLKSGGAYVPIDPEYPEERVRFLLEDAAPKVLFLHSDDLFTFSEYEGQLFAMDLQADMLVTPDSDPANSPEITSPAYLIYTSGSTGQPKGVQISHRSLLNTLLWRKEAYAFTAQDRVLQMPSFAFDSSVVDIFTPWLAGACLVVPEASVRNNAEDLIELMQQAQISHFLMVPSLYAAMLRASRPLPNSLRVITLAGEALPQTLAAQHFASYPAIRVFNEYGPTENTVCSTFAEVLIEKSITIGQPISNVEIMLRDEAGRLCPPGVPGEIFLAGAGVAIGYHGDAQRTAERFPIHPDNPEQRMYRSGDRALWTQEGNLSFLGRVDKQVKIRGFRVEPGEIEVRLAKHPAIAQVQIFVAGQENNRALAAAIVLRQEESEKTLRSFLGEQVPDYMVPGRFLFLPEFPSTPNGKIDEKALCALVETEQVVADFLAPRTEQETAIALALAKVLGREQVGAKDDFFNLGGDSIKAIQTISELARQGWKVEMGDIFNQPVVEDLALFLQEGQQEIDQGLVVGALPLTPIQQWMFQHYAATATHYNQSVLLQLHAAADLPALDHALEALQQHHDGLRTTYTLGQSAIEAQICPLPFPVQLTEYLPETDLEQVASELQAQVDLEKGPLLRVAVFRREDGDRLLLILHHLIADGVSWRILLEDLAYAYRQGLAGQPITFPPKTHAFRDWAQALQTFAAASMPAGEKQFWLDQSAQGAPLLPQDHAGPCGQEKDRKTVTYAFEPTFTTQLLEDAPAAYHTEINDLLLAAWGLCVREWTGADATLLQMEGHGREDIDANLDISRTIGWFTTLFPLRLDLSEAAAPGPYLKSIKEQIRQIPRKGLGYGVLKYLSTAPALQNAPLPQLEFNYLGQFDADLDAQLFAPAPEEPGPMISPEAEVFHGLGLNGMVIGGVLRMSLHYSSLQYEATTATRLLDRFAHHLQMLVQHCLSQEDRELTPSDLTHSEISQDELDFLGTLVEDL